MTDIKRLREDTRSVSVTLAYALGLVITTILIAGILLAAGDFATDNQERAVRSGLQVVGNQLADDLGDAERMKDGTANAGKVRVRADLPRYIAGTQYTIEINSTGGSQNYIHLRSDRPAVEVTVPFGGQVAIEDGQYQGGPLNIQCGIGSDGYAELDRTNPFQWTASASDTNGGSSPNLVFDGEVITEREATQRELEDHYWQSGVQQYDGMWFRINMQAPQDFNTVILDGRGEPDPDYPDEFVVRVGNSPSNLTQVKTGSGTQRNTTIFLNRSYSAQYIEIQTTAPSDENGQNWWWTIGEVYVLAGNSCADATTLSVVEPN